MSREKSQRSLKQEIEAEISEELYLSKDVVKQVVDSYLSILKREIVHRGEVVIKGLLSVKTQTKKAHRRKGVNGETKEFPESQYLSVSLSKPVRDEFRRIHEPEETAFPKQDDEVLMNPFIEDME